MTLEEKLKAIKPGKTYPNAVYVTETIDGEECKIRFLLQSYYVGMYCAIYVSESTRIPHQTGDHDNKRIVRRLKKDVKAAIGRGAKVEIGDVLNCKLSLSA